MANTEINTKIEANNNSLQSIKDLLKSWNIWDALAWLTKISKQTIWENWEIWRYWELWLKIHAMSNYWENSEFYTAWINRILKQYLTPDNNMS